MNAHQADSERAHTAMVTRVVRRTAPANRSRIRGTSPGRPVAACHSSGSGTCFRIQNTSSAGSTPTRKT